MACRPTGVGAQYLRSVCFAASICWSVGVAVGFQGKPKPADDVEKLSQAALSGREPEKIEALKKLEKLGKKAEAATRAVVRSAIEDASPSIREQARKVLLKVNPKLGKPILVLIEQQDAKKAVAAADELGALKQDAEPATPALLVALRAFDNPFHQPEKPKHDSKVIESCVNAIAAICPSDRDLLGELGQTAVLNKEAAVRLAAVKCIAAIAGCHAALAPDAKKYLQNMLLDSDTTVRRQVFIELSQLDLSARERLVIGNAARKDADAEIQALAEKIGAKR